MLRHGRQIVLGQREENRDRLHLRDHDETVRIGRVHHVSWIDEADTDAAGDRRLDVAVVDVESRLLNLRFV